MVFGGGEEGVCLPVEAGVSALKVLEGFDGFFHLSFGFGCLLLCLGWFHCYYKFHVCLLRVGESKAILALIIGIL